LLRQRQWPAGASPHPFDGRHEIPEDVVIALNEFLAGVRGTF
jgi:hypothetical protein